MKTPFPGMDPYIEQCGLWADFHDDLIAEIKRSLAAQLPERYFVQTGERSYIVLAGTDEKETIPIYPDVAPDVAIEESTRRVGSAARAGTVAVAEPAIETGSVTMRAFIDDHFRENFIEIYEAEPETRLVTCIE